MIDNDVQFEKNSIVFNYRVAIIIRKENKILVQKDTRVTHLALPGGRCGLGESSNEAASGRSVSSAVFISSEGPPNLQIVSSDI